MYLYHVSRILGDFMLMSGGFGPKLRAIYREPRKRSLQLEEKIEASRWEGQVSNNFIYREVLGRITELRQVPAGAVLRH